jgi:hypothetical protein
MAYIIRSSSKSCSKIDIAKNNIHRRYSMVPPPDLEVAAQAEVYSIRYFLIEEEPTYGAVNTS